MIKGSWTQKPTYLGQSEIVDLSGQPQVEFRHYAGYVRINEDKSMFYWFYKAVKSPRPGCSSIAKGALQELGPFLVRNDGYNLVFNPYTWSNVANLLFLESPVGVVFSYSNKSSDLENQNDEITAKDRDTFLINWFIKFLEFKSHEFYIAGECYADGAVLMQSTRDSIMSMNLKEKTGDMWGGWRKWYYEGQIVGWMVEYVEGLSFITIRGARHMVPTDAPGCALIIFSQFIKGWTLPNSTNTKI
ncbi:serine carboxypeptidase-like 35 [Canna indica]|uniref:Serine carboxypeptidase-like 35 n=1 Tax=Canna indica TaxID=4628 RepID=A0AAQ3JPT7_9LILI|nr:serine carboxypeptidase-like 35 [Canna indica]